MATNGIKEVKISNTNYLIEPTLLGTCGTTAATAIKDVTLSNFELFSGVQIAVKFSTTNTAAVGDLKLRVNSSDAKPIKYRGGNLPAAGTLAANRVYNFVYDGTNWELVGDLDTDTNTHRPIQVNGTQVLGNNTTALNLKSGTNVTVSGTANSSDITINAVDTTYTFENGTNGFKVTPSGGTAQTVTVTPSIANNITGSGTANYLTKFTDTNTIGNSGLTTDTNNNLTIPGTIYFSSNTSTSTGKALFAYNSSYPNFGIWYKEGTPDVMAFSTSGNADTTTSADFAIEGGGKLYNKGNIVPNTGNSTGTVGSDSQPVYINAGTITSVNKQKTANALINALDTGSSNLTANDYVITQYVGGGTTTTTYHRRPANLVVNSTLVKAALGTVSTTAKKFLKDTGAWVQVDWADLTGKPTSFNPTTHNHSQIVTVGDNRSVATTPNDYKNTLIFQGLKDNGYIGSPSTNTYSYVVGLRGWSDSSGGDSHEFAFNNNGINWRHGATDTWSEWKTIAYTDSTVARATADASGNTITSTYAPLASPTFTGTPTAPTAANGTSTTQIATTEFVNNTLAYANAMTFKGTLGTDGTITALPASHNAGDTYRVITAGTWAGKYCEVGTLIVCTTDGTTANNAHWTSVETNEDGAVIGPSSSTTNSLAFFNSTTGRVIDSTSKITVYNDVDITVQGATKKCNGLHLYGTTYGNTASDLTSNTVGVMRFEDGGPRIEFSETNNESDSGAILFTNHDGALTGGGSSFHFVGKNGSNNTGGNLAVTAPDLVARRRMAIGSNFTNSSYALHVTGASLFKGNVNIQGNVIWLQNANANQNAAGSYPYITSLRLGDAQYVSLDEYKDDILSVHSKGGLLLYPNATIAVYDNTKTYAVNDIVWYDRQYYYCKTAIETAEEWTSSHWTAFPVAAGNVWVWGGINPIRNNAYNLGTSSYKWNNIYATTFNGDLNGNAKYVKQYYSTNSTDAPLQVRANDADAYIWQAGHASSATGGYSNNYALQYLGTGTSPNNYLILKVSNSSTVTDAIKVDELGNVTFTNTILGTIKHATAAHWSTQSSSLTGVLKVKIKKKQAWMIAFTIRVYQSYAYDDYVISGYNYGSNKWYNPEATILGSESTSKHTVTFGYDDDANSSGYRTLWVSIPIQSYTGIDIFNITNGHSQITDMSDAFEIIHETESTGTVQTTVDCYRPWYRNETVSNATTATNLSAKPSLAASGNNITVTAGGKTSDAFTVPYATTANSSTTATTANILACPSITTETDIEGGTRTYQGSGSTWTGSVASMTYAGILQICGGYARGWQIWATRGPTESLHWRNPNSEATAWNTERIILDSGNYTDYTVTKTGTGASGTWDINAATSSYLKANSGNLPHDHGLQYYSDQPTIGSADGNAYAGSSNNYKLWSYPDGATSASGGTANVQVLRLWWGATYLHDIFVSPNYEEIYHRSIIGGTAKDWRKFLDSENTAAGTNNNATLAWNTTYTIAKINGTDIKFKTMAKPTYTYSDVGAAAATHYHNCLNGIGRLSASADAIAFNTSTSVGNRMSWCIYDSTSRSKDATNSPTFDATTLNMPWDWGAYVTQLALQNAGTRLQIRGANQVDHGEGANPRYTPTYTAWREIVTADKATQMGSSTQPVYISSTGQVVACTAYDSASVNYATSAGSATSATTASKLSNTAAIGSNVKPVYFTNGGVPQATETEMIRGFTTDSAGTNLNAFYDSGMYSITGGSLTNYPTGGSAYGTILTVAYRKPSGNAKPDYAWQMGNFTQNNDRLWYRTSQADTWRTWRQVVNIATNTAVGDGTTPVYVTADGEVKACTAYSSASVANATNASKISAKLAATTKTYLLGTATTITATAANVEITGDTGVYLTTTAGELSAARHSWNVSGTEKAYTVYNTTDDSIDFVFI